MDIDNAELDLLNSFRSMNTNDKDHLIKEFKRLLSNTQVSDEVCCFYLDMAEWNLNTALWTFYEYEGSSNATHNVYNYGSAAYSSQLAEPPQMRFLSDITNGEGESIPPNTKFIKTWRILNSGNTKWPSGCQLKYVNGYNFTLSSHSHFAMSMSSMALPVGELMPNESADISVEMNSPSECGIYQCQLRLYTESGQPFGGDEIWIVVTVEQTGIMGITQQLTNVNMIDFQKSSHNNNNNNKTSPFNLDSNSNFINPFSKSHSSSSTSNATKQ